MKRAPFSAWVFLLPLIPVILGFVLDQSDSRLQHAMRVNLFDQYQRWHPRDYTPAPVSIIDIDEESIARAGQWPWPRIQIASLLEKLHDAGAAVVGFDILFSEPDRTSPTSTKTRRGKPGRHRLPTDHDLSFAQEIEQSNVVVGFALERSLPAKALPKYPDVKAAIRYSDETQTRWLHTFATAITALPEIQSAASGNGALSFVADGDGVVRRVPLVMQIGSTPVPTLASEALRIAMGAQEILLIGIHPDAGLQGVRIGDIDIPTTPEGEVLVHYTQPVPARYLPAWQVLEGKLTPDQLGGHIVLVGSSVQGLMDLRFSPFGILPGVEISAQVVEQALQGDFLARPSWTHGVEMLMLSFGSLIVGLFALRARALAATVGCMLFVIGVLAGGWYAFVGHGILFDSATPAIGAILSFLNCSLAHHLSSEREQRWIRSAFSRYVSPNRVDYLVKNPEAMELGGRRQVCSFVFTDLAGFTTLIESMDPGQAVALLNAYLEGMIAIVFRHEGTLDRIVGDAVVVMFSAPVVQEDHPQRALACALEMDEFARSYARNLQEKGIPFGNTRIGVNSGEVIVGNFGGATMFDYRALGDPCNTAARLETLNKHTGTQICVSAATLAGCPAAHVRPIGRFVLKGKSKPIEVFEPCRQAPEADYLAAYEAMREQRPEARSLFESLRATQADDPLVRYHCQRLADNQSGDLIVMTDK